MGGCYRAFTSQMKGGAVLKISVNFSCFLSGFLVMTAQSSSKSISCEHALFRWFYFVAMCLILGRFVMWLLAEVKPYAATRWCSAACQSSEAAVLSGQWVHWFNKASSQDDLICLIDSFIYHGFLGITDRNPGPGWNPGPGYNTQGPTLPIDPQRSEWGTQNPLDGDTWFVGFITHRSVQSVFSQKALKLLRHRQ